MNEASIQQQIRLAAAYAGIELYRNNSGACKDETGRMIRYGLGNDSAKVNANIKSSDLIGVTPLFVMPEHVGTIVGVFTAIECKAPGWRMRPSDDRALAQQRFHDIVRAAGGYAGFAASADDVWGIVRRRG
ncbi:MAG TPA: hypothetical protein PK205_07045 [Promineifilum sp.]|nr:hypothetical protein [Promineifilum sp.]